MKNFSVLFSSLVLILLFSGKLFSQSLPEKPTPPRLVNDLAGFLANQERDQLEQKLVDFSRSTSTQISVVIVPDLQGFEVADYASRLGEKWGIGQKGSNNGVLLLIKPKNGTEKGQINISTGYGLEAAIPDALAHRIIEEILIPHFKQGQFFQGIDVATNSLMKLSVGEFPEKEFASGKQKTPLIPLVILGVLFLLFVLIAGKANKSRGNHIGKSGLPFWVALSLLSHMGRGGGGGGGFSDFSSGGGSFGGFGGGSFGGGGASGSW
jgi:uncharacterized protein